MAVEFQTKPPKVQLRDFTQNAYDDAIAAARTCYAKRVMYPEDVLERHRDLIGPLTFNAGHHTVYQHATFEFSLENVSRHFIWGVLHAHPFYNSEQQSQRYVKMSKAQAYLPKQMSEDAQKLYKETTLDAYQAYRKLSEVLYETTFERMKKRRHLDKHPHERLLKPVRKEAEKKAIEIARYVLPISTFTALVFTCSGLVLHRLYRLMKTGDVSEESTEVIGQMVDLVKAQDPHFFSKVGDEPLEEHEIPEHSLLQAPSNAAYQPADWDKKLGKKRMSKLMSYTSNAKEVLAESIRYALGPEVNTQTDDELIDWVLNPKRNSYRLEKTNLSTHSPLTRSLNHIHYSFLKKLSHSADSQNQRHRMVPGSRPFFTMVDADEPDYYTPMLIRENAEAQDIYHTFMEKVWTQKQRLIEMGVPRRQAVYVLPNAVNIRFVESGSLLNLMHKWTLRTCLNAQEEIFEASMEEVKQVFQVHPFLEKYLGPPCVVRNGAIKPRCSEGNHFCGVPVWNQFPAVQRSL